MHRRFVFRDVDKVFDVKNALTGTLLAKEESVVILETEDGPYSFNIEKGKSLQVENVPVSRITVASGKVQLVGYIHEPDITKPPRAYLGGEIFTLESAPTLENRLDEMLTKFGLAPYPLLDNSINIKGGWNTYIQKYRPLGVGLGTYDTSTPGSMEVEFYGDKFAILFYSDQSSGIANIYVDGKLIAQVDLYSDTPTEKTFFYSGLEDGKHILKIENSGQKNPNSSNYKMQIDGLFFPAGKNPFVVYDRYLREMGYMIFYHGLVEPYYNVLTTTPLANGSSYISNWEDRSSYGFSYILVTVYADTDMDVYVEQSPNRSDITHVTHLAYTANDDENNILKVQLVSRYVRVRVVNNSGTDQTKLIVERRYSMA